MKESRSSALSCIVVAWLSLTSTLSCASASRILLSSLQHPSHMLPLLAVGEELVRRGHDVYLSLSSAFADRQFVELHGVHVLTFHATDVQQDTTGRSSVARLLTKANTDCDRMMSDQSFLDAARRLDFDLVIVQPDVLSPCTLLLPHRLDVPFVSMTNHFIPWMIRLPVIPSFYVPSEANLTAQSWLLPSVFNAVSRLVSQVVETPQLWNATLLSRYAADVSSWQELLLRSQMILIGTDHHLQPDLPLFPNVIAAPGVTARSAKPLPDDLKSAVEYSDVTVVASFGPDLAVSVVNKLLATFEQLQQLRVTVVARFETPMSGITVPSNVRLMSWLPQNDLLGQSRTAAFITQCDVSGLYEALYHRVPILGVPPSHGVSACDCGRVASLGLGIILDVDHFTTDQLKDSIMELLNNASYRDAVRRLSSAWRDEPLMGREKAGFWIEHVIKYGGAHLRSPAMDLPLRRFLMLDVLAVMSTWLLLAVFFLIAACRWCCSRSSERKSSDEKKLL